MWFLSIGEASRNSEKASSKYRYKLHRKDTVQKESDLNSFDESVQGWLNGIDQKEGMIPEDGEELLVYLLSSSE